MKKNRLIFVVAILFVGQFFVINYLLSNINVDLHSSYDRLFRSISNFQRFLFGRFSFSIGDLFYFIFFGFVLSIVIKWLKNLKSYTVSFLIKLLSSLTILVFCFYLFWGFNYARVPLYKTLGLNFHNINTKELIQLNKELIAKANMLQLTLSKNDTTIVRSPYNDAELIKYAQASYQELAQEWPIFKYQNPSVKYSMYSIPLSYMGYSGYYNPFTGEAQVNYDMVKPYIPFTVCHEIGHQLGFAAEQEANFLGYLACISSRDTFVQYSGYLVALSYTLTNLQYVDQDAYKAIMKTVNIGVNKNFEEHYKYWMKHQNPSTKIFHGIYDRYLKANKQKDGIKSYYGIVKLIMAYHQSYPLKNS